MLISYADRNINLREKPISHHSLQKFVNSLDIGEIHTIPGFRGAYRSVTALTTMIIDLHLKSPSLRKKLL